MPSDPVPHVPDHTLEKLHDSPSAPPIAQGEAETDSNTPAIPAQAGGTLLTGGALPGVQQATTAEGRTLSWSGAAPPGLIGRSDAPPGYEILSELGRGGMGVVYQARHLLLNRVVALKMILAGGHASAVELARFQVEARAVARLQHSGIVQIHEVGEHAGRPYFALEFVAGGSLSAKLRGQPWPIGRATEVVEQLATAMQHAHQNGVVHRDLKPANVLLAADGTPRITDFGLAKQMDAEQDLSRSGAIMGTPSYMAPEQAEGRIHDIGPAADVYALGAILYELLTGRPPFRAATVLDTLEQVRKQEPAAPSRLQPKTPRDLETICLKCLHKEPARRYASAAELAEDLRRYRCSEPIRARPVGRMERVLKWIRRSPARAAILGMIVLIAVLSLATALVWLRAERTDAARARMDRRRTELLAALDNGLKPAQWTADHLVAQESLLSELESLDSSQAAAARTRLHQSYAEAIRDLFTPARKPVLRATDVPPIEEHLKVLAVRDAQLAATLRQDLQKRVRTPSQIVDLKAPFDKADEVFPALTVRVVDGALEPLLPPKGKRDPRVRTLAPFAGDVEFDAVFESPKWADVAEAALVLHYADGKEYVFALRLPDVLPADSLDAAPKPAQSFAEVVRGKGALKIQIERSNLRLRSREVLTTEVWVPETDPGRLHLQVKVQGDRLIFTVNDMPPLEFQELFLSSGGRGVFGLVWPAGVRLESMRAWSQSTPSAPSPLERGDEAFAHNKWADALEEYQRQEAVSSDPQVQQEARLKRALCLLELKRPLEASPILQAFVDQPGDDRWKLLAASRLWAIRLDEGKDAEAEALFNLFFRARLTDLAILLPDSVRDAILSRYRSIVVGGWSAFAPRAHRRKNLEQALLVEEMFQAPRSSRSLTLFSFFRAAWLTDGNVDQAAQIAERLLVEEPNLTGLNARWWFQLREEYCLLLRQTGQAATARTKLDLWLFAQPGMPYPDRLALLVERARLDAALSDWDAAEKDLNDFFRLVPVGTIHCRFWAQACLAQGFVLDRKGDKAGARAAWRRGLPRVHPNYSGRTGYTSPISYLTQIVLAALAQDDIPAPEMQSLIELGWNWITSLSNQTTLRIARAILESQIGLSADVQMKVLRDFGKSAEGRELGRQFAFQERPLPDLTRDIVVMGSAGGGRQLLAPLVLSAEQETLLRQFLDEFYRAATNGKLPKDSKKEMFALLGVWSGSSGPDGWQALEKLVESPLREKATYFLGLRYLHHLKKPAEAARFFEIAVAKSPPDSLVHRLARAELDQLKKK